MVGFLISILLFFIYYLFDRHLVKAIFKITNRKVFKDKLSVRYRIYKFPIEERFIENKFINFNKDKSLILVMHPYIINDKSSFQIRVQENINNHLIPFLKNLTSNFDILFVGEKLKILNRIFNSSLNNKKFLINSSKINSKLFFLKCALSGHNTIFICGYSLNSCLSEDDFGIQNLLNYGFNVILIRDLTIAIEHINAELELSYNSMIAYLESDRITTITSSELLTLFK